MNIQTDFLFASQAMTNVSCHVRRLLAVIIFPLSIMPGYSQDTKVSVTNYEGTTKKKVEYQYIPGRKTKAQNIEYRDSNTKLLTGYDANTYSVQEIIPHGYWKEYYLNGNVKAEYNFVDGVREGVAKLFYENGNIEKQFTFNSGRIDGEFLEHYNNGALQAKCTYVNGIRTGNSTVYDPDKNPILYLKYSAPQAQPGRSMLIAGEEAQVAKVFAQSKHPNGRIAEEGYLESYYSVRGFAFYYDDNFRREGPWRQFDDSGVKVSETTFRNSQVDGLYTSYYLNGKKKEEMTYIPSTYSNQTISIVDGVYKIYYENGQLAKVGTMKTLVTKSKANEEELETELYNAGDWKRYDESGRLIEFKSLGRGDEILCEMDAQQIEAQSNISDQLELAKYRDLSVSKFTKYIRFHYGELLDNQNNILVPDNKPIFEEIHAAAMSVFEDYVIQLKACPDKPCVTDYANKLSNILMKLDQIRTDKSIASLYTQVRQYGVRQVLKI